MATGIEPRWNGTLTACATVSPRASSSAAEKSMPSRTTVECAVRKIVVATSSAIDASALATICSVTGSTLARSRVSGIAALEHETLRTGVAADGPAGRHDHRRVVLVD